MSLRRLFSAIVCLALCGSGWADEFDNDAGDVDFPYDAFVNTDDVYVRSGPGQNYYPVLRLQRGDRISVYRHDPGGWYAIRPPAECFSWVSAEFVEPGEGKMARIKGDRVVARVGSAFSDIRDVIQVRLDEGELVEVLEAKRIGTGPAAQTWYKISPPAGEFRWVSGQFISSERPEREARKRDAHNNLLIARHAKQHEQDLDDHTAARHENRRAADRDEDDEPRQGPQARQVKFRSSGGDRDNQDRDDDDRASDDRKSERPTAKHRSTSHRALDDEDRDEPALDRRRPAGQASRRAPLPQGDVALMKELEDLDYQLSAEVAKEPAHWNLVPLHERSDALLARSDTALDRGRVRLVQRKISRFEDIKQRADKIASAQRATDLHNQDAIRASLGGSLGVPMDERFDGVGKLTQIYPAQSGVASYALVDKNGKVKQYVTAAPGVNLRPFIGREVGVQGTLGYMTDAQTSHLTAKRVALMDEGRVVR